MTLGCDSTHLVPQRSWKNFQELLRASVFYFKVLYRYTVLCESHAILSILLSGQLCTFWSLPPHGLIILPISFLCWFWKRASNEKYQLQLRIIFLKGEADVYTKSGASWAAEWDFAHLLEWAKSMLALACSYLSSLLQGRSDGKAMASMVCEHWDMTWHIFCDDPCAGDLIGRLYDGAVIGEIAAARLDPTSFFGSGCCLRGLHCIWP